MQPEGVAEKLGGGRVDGCRDILTHFQIHPADLCCDERGVGWRKRGGAVFWFSMQKIIKSVRMVLSRGKSVLFPYEALPSAPNRMKTRQNETGRFITVNAPIFCGNVNSV